jgi:hypothetical protein
MDALPPRVRIAEMGAAAKAQMPDQFGAKRKSGPAGKLLKILESDEFVSASTAKKSLG